jgi:hypothetical protein
MKQSAPKAVAPREPFQADMAEGESGPIKVRVARSR